MYMMLSLQELHRSEQVAIPKRMEMIEKDYNLQVSREKELQDKYLELVQEMQSVHASVEG